MEEKVLGSRPLGARVSYHLERTEVAPEVPHPRPTRDAASDAVARASVCVFVFFFFSRIRVDLARFAPTRLDLCQIGFDSCRTGLIRLESGGRYGRNMPKTAETGRNRT